MTLLKLKAFIYQKTGIYLASKEELDYVTSPQFWEAFKKLQQTKDWKKEDPRNIQGVLIGSWQIKHGFYRTYKPRKRK